MQVLLDARKKLNISWGTDGQEQDVNYAKLLECNAIEALKFLEFAPLIQRLWKDRGIRRAFERRREFQIVSGFFFNLKFFFAIILFRAIQLAIF